jgi:hypothetical protein
MRQVRSAGHCATTANPTPGSTSCSSGKPSPVALPHRGVRRRARGGLCNCRHVAECFRGTVVGKLAWDEHRRMKAPLLALSHSGGRPTRPYPVREQRSSYPFRARHNGDDRKWQFQRWNRSSILFSCAFCSLSFVAS